MSSAVLAAGHAETTAANCAAIIDATARVASSCSRPFRSSMASAPMQASGPNIGVTMAPLPAAWAATIVAWPVRQAVAVALSAARGDWSKAADRVGPVSMRRDGKQLVASAHPENDARRVEQVGSPGQQGRQGRRRGDARQGRAQRGRRGQDP